MPAAKWVSRWAAPLAVRLLAWHPSPNAAHSSARPLDGAQCRSGATVLEHALRSQLPGVGAVSRQHAMNCARAASSSAYASNGCDGGWPDDVSNFAYMCVHALAGAMRLPCVRFCGHRKLSETANSLGPPTCLNPPLPPPQPFTCTRCHVHMRPRSNALATEASLPYNAASGGCPDGQLITGPTAAFPEVGS
jgi:hypothetical protein